MNTRKLYIAAYDVADPKRLRQALHILKDYASGGQKSVFECYLTETERRTLLARVEAVLDPDEDRFMILPLAGRHGIRTLGIAVPPEDPDYYYVG